MDEEENVKYEEIKERERCIAAVRGRNDIAAASAIIAGELREMEGKRRQREMDDSEASSSNRQFELSKH